MKFYYMMELSKCLFLFFIIFFFKECSTETVPEQSSYCHDEERSALLQFKESFTIDASASGLEGAYPKVSSWKPAQGGNNTNCCGWDGVECDEQTGHVIGLDLRSSCLYGSINSSSSLFRLVHLQRLDLADNHFNYSQIPNSIRNFPRLTHLDLSASVFSGPVPAEVSQLVKLSLLNLSFNTEPSSGVGLLSLDGSNFRSLVQNLTSLEHLRLRYTNISSTIPYTMANLSFLTTLDLHQCELFGDFPVPIFQLKNLSRVYLRDNQDLIGYLPEFNRSSRLTTLDLHGTRFSGDFPSSIGNIDSLKQLDVGACQFSAGLIPSSLGNLRNLTYLDLSWLFRGPIPDSFANLTKLTLFRMYSCRLTGPLPSWLGRFSQLTYLDLAFNTLNSSVPASFSNLTNLEILFLQFNQLSGMVEFQIFQTLKNLKEVDLSFNNLEFVSKSTDKNATNFPQLTLLNLLSINIYKGEFPYFLKHQNSLEWLDLHSCNLQGQVPKWMYNVSTKTLRQFSIGDNLLSGQIPTVLPWVNLQYFGVAINNFHGELPVPAASTFAYRAQGNNFTGEVLPWICNLSSLQVLDLSNNRFSGMIPHCFKDLKSLRAIHLSNNNFSGMFPLFLGNFSDRLELIRLENNSFHGHLPQTFSNNSNLRLIDVSYNQLQGPLPRSLANCVMLETLILSNNNFSDIFPIWLRNLPELKVLALRRNVFLGVIGKPGNNQGFPKLRIFDISHNNFTGEFQAEHIFSEYAMRPNISVNGSEYMTATISMDESAYIDAAINYNAYQDTNGLTYDSTITITCKGVDRYYSKIHKALAVIDISSNKFEGKIDAWIGNLKGLMFLNVSNNLLTGEIPLSFGTDLKDLESLDLSNNKLSGQIPQQLAQLTFLAEFNVSHNNLTGPIPSGTQLQGFGVTSYEGNSGLCGDPLPKKCGNSDSQTPVTPSCTEDNDSWYDENEFDWRFVLAGLGSGLVVGVVLADVAITRRPQLFLEMVGRLAGLMESITMCKRFGDEFDEFIA